MNTETYVLPSSFTQRRLWMLDQMSPGAVTYHIVWAVELTGPLGSSKFGAPGVGQGFDLGPQVVELLARGPTGIGLERPQLLLRLGQFGPLAQKLAEQLLQLGKRRRTGDGAGGARANGGGVNIHCGIPLMTTLSGRR